MELKDATLDQLETIKKVNGVDFEEFAKQIINLIPEWEC